MKILAIVDIDPDQSYIEPRAEEKGGGYIVVTRIVDDDGHSAHVEMWVSTMTLTTTMFEWPVQLNTDALLGMRSIVR